VIWVQVVPFQCAINEYSVPGLGPPPIGTENMPTAKQLFALGHDTLDKRSTGAPGFGLVTIVQVEPFQRSMSVKVFEPSPEPPAALKSVPTAKHVVALAHDTLARLLSLRTNGGFSARFGLGVIVQVEPFHCSMRVWVAPWVKPPTAVQLVVFVHETLARPLGSLPWFGLGTIDHVEPFQRSMSVLATDLIVEPPTAKHTVVLGHDKPDNPLAVAPGAFGLATTVQPVQVGRSISVVDVPFLVSSPTAKHVLIAPAHATSNRALLAPGGLTLDRIDHDGTTDGAAVADAIPAPENNIIATTMPNDLCIAHAPKNYPTLSPPTPSRLSTYDGRPRSSPSVRSVSDGSASLWIAARDELYELQVRPDSWGAGVSPRPQAIVT
jgi:hypothetical protein